MQAMVNIEVKVGWKPVVVTSTRDTGRELSVGEHSRSRIVDITVVMDRLLCVCTCMPR